MDYRQKRPDTRAFLFAIILFSISIFSIKNFLGIIMLQVIVLGFEMILKEWRILLKHALPYSMMLVLIFLLSLWHESYITAVFLLVLSLMIRAYPIYSLFGLWITRTPLDEIMIALQRFKIPNWIILTLIVTVRYIPTICKEANCIFSNIQMQKTKKKNKYYWSHPQKLVEMIMVPLLIRSSKISDELTDSALTKGYQFQRKLGSMTQVKFTMMDLFFCLGTILLDMLLMFAFR